jgi:hypothetical protein
MTTLPLPETFDGWFTMALRDDTLAPSLCLGSIAVLQPVDRYLGPGHYLVDGRLWSVERPVDMGDIHLYRGGEHRTLTADEFAMACGGRVAGVYMSEATRMRLAGGKP